MKKLITINFDDNKKSEMDAPSDIFSAEVRQDLIHAVVKYQLAKRQSGTHKTKTRSETSCSTRKIVRQKGSGGARHGSRDVVQFRGGGTTKGPVPRSRAYKLNKKVRRAALLSMLSAKGTDIMLLRNIVFDALKTSDVARFLSKNDMSSTLFLVPSESWKEANRPISNIESASVLSVEGLNVYDLIRHDTVLMTESALELLKERLQ